MTCYIAADGQEHGAPQLLTRPSAFALNAACRNTLTPRLIPTRGYECHHVKRAYQRRKPWERVNQQQTMNGDFLQQVRW